MDRTRAAGFGLLVGISVGLFWRPITLTFLLSLHDDAYTHILIVVPVAASFFILERQKLKKNIRRVPWFFPALLFAAAGLMWLAARKGDISHAGISLTLAMSALVIWWISSFVMSFGLDAFRIFIFPLCFLVWLVPWPQSFLALAIQFLQQYSASVVAWMFQAFGIPVLKNGVILSIPGLTIEVAKECSSIRSSIILLISSIVLAQLFLRSKWRKALVIALAIPLSVAKNALRIFTLSMLGIHVNRGFLTGRLHHQGGIVFYAAALAVLFLVIYLLQKQEIAKTIPCQTAVLTPE